MKRSIFRKLIGVGLAVAVAVGGVVVPEGNMVVAHAEERTYLYPADPGGNYCDYYCRYPRTYAKYIDYLEDVGKKMPNGYGYVGKTIAVSDLGNYSKSLGDAYKSTNVNAYESVLCLLRSGTVPLRIEAYLIGYRSDGTKEIICKDDGYNIFGCNKDGVFEDGSDFQGYDSEGYGVDDGINKEGLDRNGYTRSGIPVLTNAVNKDGNVYYYNDDDVKPLSFKVGTKSGTNDLWQGSGVAFTNNNASYYKVTISGLKKSKMVGVTTFLEKGEVKGALVGQPVSSLQEDLKSSGYDGGVTSYMVSQYPVNNGKVTFYAKSYTKTKHSGNLFESYKNQNVSGMKWSYLNSKGKYVVESNVSVNLTPVAKADIKKSSTLSSAKSTLTITSKKVPNYVDLTFNEPVYIYGTDAADGGGDSLLRNKSIIVNQNAKTNKVRLLANDHECFESIKKGTFIIEGRYSGKKIKVKVISKLK